MSPTCEFLAAFLDTNVIPECAARLAAFVSAATHLFVAFSITEELSIFGCFITRDVDVGSQARLPNHILTVHFSRSGTTEARHVALFAARRTIPLVAFDGAKMAFGLMIAARQLFAANLYTCGDGVLAARPWRRIRVFLIS